MSSQLDQLALPGLTLTGTKPSRSPVKMIKDDEIKQAHFELVLAAIPMM